VSTKSKEVHALQARPPHGHERRRGRDSHRDPEAVLRRLPIGTPRYKEVAGAILKLNNHQHARKHKGVGFETMKCRDNFVMRAFRDLRKKTQFVDADPRKLGTRHVEALLKLWLERDLSTKAIHNYLSYLRTFARWVGRPGLVRPPAYYLGEASPHAHYKQEAKVDQSWSAKDVVVAAMVAKIREIDPLISLRVELCYRFALRAQESGHLRPHLAVIPRDQAEPRCAEAWPAAEFFLHVRDGTKGGRPRDVPILTDEQRDLVERAKRAVLPGQFVGHAGRSVQQNRRRFYYVLERCGITKAQLGVVSHGLRHERANDEYEQLTGTPSAVRGGTGVPRDVNAEARLKIARLLGHNRTRVTSCYLGKSQREAAERPAKTSTAAGDDNERDAGPTEPVPVREV
jgi:integrase